MKTIIVYTLLLLTGSVYAQHKPADTVFSVANQGARWRDSMNRTGPVREMPGQGRIPADTTLLPQPRNRMPNALAVPGAPDLYKGNNGQGFDLYQSPVDNMPILMPDSGNRASMRVRTIQKSIVPLKKPRP